MLDTPRGLQSLHPGIHPTDKDCAGQVSGPNATKPAGGVSAMLELHSNIYQTITKASWEVIADDAKTLAAGAKSSGIPNGISGSRALVTFLCDTCGVDCTPVRYHALKVKNFELCPPCYLDGRFPSTMFSGDFVELTSTQNTHGSSDNWTDQEILLLLEGVEMCNDNWSLIEECVSTRSTQQCIWKFLELPIEDS